MKKPTKAEETQERRIKNERQASALYAQAVRFEIDAGRAELDGNMLEAHAMREQMRGNRERAKRLLLDF